MNNHPSREVVYPYTRAQPTDHFAERAPLNLTRSATLICWGLAPFLHPGAAPHASPDPQTPIRYCHPLLSVKLSVKALTE